MRAQGVGVVIAVGERSKFQVGDYVSGAWGVLFHRAERGLSANGCMKE